MVPVSKPNTIQNKSQINTKKDETEAEAYEHIIYVIRGTPHLKGNSS